MSPKTTAKDFFLNLGVFIGLYVSIVSWLTLVFAIINKVLPFAGSDTLGYDGTIRISLAILIIFCPTFFYLSWLVFKDLKANPEKKDIWVRKWMIFFTLFISGLTIAIDMAVLIYRFLGAEDLSVQFFLKVFFVLGSALQIFRFYFYELKRNPADYKKSMKIRLWAIWIITLASIVYGMMLIGSPAEQRAKAFDDTRVTDLMTIQNQIVYTQWENKGSVPATLAVLTDPISGFSVPTDPQTGASYEYKMLSNNSFELCATFQTASDGTSNTMSVAPATPAATDPADENWQHGIGRVCFDRTIDPSLYKVIPAPTATK